MKEEMKGEESKEIRKQEWELRTEGVKKERRNEQHLCDVRECVDCSCVLEHCIGC